MDFSVILKIKDTLRNMCPYILKLFGKKIVDLDYYKCEEEEVDDNYDTTSPKCITETKKGAKFRWSIKYRKDYSKYYEIDNHIHRYFRSKGILLWIKKPYIY
ncbi:MAG: hypothetical protein P1U74_11350 [Legionellaceae bacterium]|nr:hypothetical protein [Legionellaceae bacterium]